VLNAEGIVLGRLTRTELDTDADLEVVDAMREGPTTVRPSEPLDDLVTRMRGADVDAILVTRSDGTLMGVLERAAGQRALEELGGADRPPS
jgi:CBS domain-containing protein